MLCCKPYSSSAAAAGTAEAQAGRGILWAALGVAGRSCSLSLPRPIAQSVSTCMVTTEMVVQQNHEATSVRGIEEALQPKTLLVILAKPWMHVDRHLLLLAHAVSNRGMRALMKKIWLNYTASTGKGSAKVVPCWEDALQRLNPVRKEKLKEISKLIPEHICALTLRQTSSSASVWAVRKLCSDSSVKDRLHKNPH